MHNKRINKTKQLRNDMNEVFNSEAGQRVFNYLASYGHLYSQPSTEESLDTNSVLLREGRRDILLEIVRCMKISDEKIQIYIKEYYE